jgi:hypothetical protein
MAVQKRLFHFPVALAAAGFLMLAGATQSRADIALYLCGQGLIVCGTTGVNTNGSDLGIGTIIPGITPNTVTAADTAAIAAGLTVGETDYIWNYALGVLGNEQTYPNPAPNNSYVTLYDIPGIIAGSAIQDTKSGGVTTSEQFLGETPTAPLGGCCTPPDSPTMLNVTWSTKFPVIGPQYDDGFAFESIFGGIGPNRTLSWTQQAYPQGDPDPADVQTGEGSTYGPVTPEPTTIFLMGSALVGLGLLRRKKRHQ